MPFGASDTQSSGEFISHFNAIRFRVVGNGSLKLTFKSMDEVMQVALPPVALNAATNREPRVLANFQQQRAMLEGYTTDINETFKINRVIIFASSLWTEYPG